MFSSYHGDNSGQASSGCEEPKEEIEAPAAQASGAGEAGDGSWVKSGRKDKRNSKRFEKRQLREPFVSSDGDSIHRISAQARHVRFSNLHVQPPKCGRSWSEELDESDEDPWLEPNKRPDLPCETTAICDTGCEKLFVPKKCDHSDQGSKHIPVKTSMEVTMKSPETPDLNEADREGDLEVSTLGDSQEKEKKMKQMMHMVGMVPGMHQPMPIQRVPVPFMAAGNPHLGSPVRPPAGEIPPQYEMMHMAGMVPGMHQPTPIQWVPVPFMAAGNPHLGSPVCPPAGEIPPQYEMMHMAGMVPGMHQPMPIQRVPVPFMAAGNPHLGSPVCPPAGEIPPQYEMMHMAGMVPGMHQPMPIQRVPVPFMAAGNPHLGSPVCPPAGEIPPQYEMMHMAGMVPGMHQPMPIQRVPVPFMAAGNPHLGSPVCPPAGEIPPQYEFVWKQMMHMAGMVPGMHQPMPNQRVPVPFMAARIPCLALPVSPHAGTIHPQYEVNAIPAVAVSAESVSQHSSSSNAVGASWVTKKKKGPSRRAKRMWTSPVNVLN